MDQFNGMGFPYSISTTLNEEYFDFGYRYGLNPNYHLMNEQEIPVEPPRAYYLNEYPSNNNQQMHQLYHADDGYGNDGYRFHSPRHGYNYPYAPQRSSFDYHQDTEYPWEQISVDILLSGMEFIDNHLISNLSRERPDLSFEESTSNFRVITVSGYPAQDSANGFLALVKEISGDKGASIVGVY